MVEKRRHPLWAMFGNQLLYAAVSFMIVTGMAGKMQIYFGLFFLFLYLAGIYQYAHKAGNDHQKSYSKIRPNAKFPVAYALCAILYVALPLGLCALFHNWYVYLAVTFWEAPFYFMYIIYRDGVVNWAVAGILSAGIALISGLGYLAGVKQFYIIRVVHSLLYRPVNNPENKSDKE